ncbi:MAG: Ldh family oxidoreductase, partial [Candidatus Aminicenantaceae bacterium]
LNEKDAALLGTSYVENNLRGVDSHGVRLVPICVKRLKEGGINPNPNITIEAETSASARLNGDNGLGQIVAFEGMNLAIKKAEETGIGFVVCANTNNAGAMGSYTRIALKKNMAALCMATTVPSMFAWGGLQRVISNPPVSIAFPGRNTRFVLDICLGSVAWNKIYTMRDKGLPIPEGWAVDRHGEMTTAPLKAADGGSVIPIGGHKGYGLSLAIELFTAILGGHLFGNAMKGLFENPKEGEGITMTLAALDVSKLLDVDILYERVDTFYQFIKNSPLKQGVTEILIPGEPEEGIQKTRREKGILLPMEVLQSLKNCAAESGISFPF